LNAKVAEVVVVELPLETLLAAGVEAEAAQEAIAAESFLPQRLEHPKLLRSIQGAPEVFTLRDLLAEAFQ